MDSKKSYIPIKVFISYLALAALVITAGWILYSENRVFSETENNITSENNKVLKVSGLLSNMYKTESMARITIQSDAQIDFKNYSDQTKALQIEIDSLKLLVNSTYQVALLDSVKYLLSKKTDNIRQLKTIKSKANDEIAVKKAINDMTRMEGSLRKLRLEDFVKDPSTLAPYQKSVLVKYVEVLNQNIPDDSTNTLSQKALDSMLVASKTLLSDVKKQTDKRNASLNAEEKKLLRNELSISGQLQKILSIIEKEIITTTTKSNHEKEISLKRTNKVVTIAAAIGLLLTLFFSLLIVTDFSKTQSYKNQLEVANYKTKTLLRNREQLISTVSHDLKTPLSTIVGYTELLGHSAPSQKQDYYIRNIKNSSEYISQLVQDLLDFTQIEAGKITVETIPFSLKDCIHEVAKSVQAVYPQKPIGLIVEVEEILAHKILSDPFRLRQILTNIIGNAYKFTDNGFIKIEAKTNPENKTIIIQIEDSGIGIREDKQQLIFEEFTQADESIEKKFGGTGLGLTISKKITEILGGTLALKSVFGKGSIFEVQIPLRLAGPLAQNENLPIKSNPKPTVIIIDDDISLLNLTTEVLRQHDYIPIPFSKGSDALEAIKETDFDVIISDIQMPDMDGFSFLEKLKKATGTHYNGQPVIAITGRADLNENTYKNSGFTTVIRKPYLPKTLIKTISAIINGNAGPENPVLDTDTKIDAGRLYCLDALKLFLPDEKTALKDVLLSFMTNSDDNLIILEKAIANNDSTGIKEISHRMYPMFKQIQAYEIARILEGFELSDNPPATIKSDFIRLKGKIKTLFGLLEKEPYSSL